MTFIPATTSSRESSGVRSGTKRRRQKNRPPINMAAWPVIVALCQHPLATNTPSGRANGRLLQFHLVYAGDTPIMRQQSFDPFSLGSEINAKVFCSFSLRS